MNTSCYQKIKEYMESQPKGTVFAKVDFGSMGSDSAVRQALSRLVKDGVCQRLLPSVYCCPKYIAKYDDFIPPSEYDVGFAIARNYGWKVALGPLIAQNELGLSTQVPAQVVFTSTGPTREYTIPNAGTVYFQHCRAKFLREMSFQSAVITNALLDYKAYDIPDFALCRIGKALSKEQKLVLGEEICFAPKWMHPQLLAIASAK